MKHIIRLFVLIAALVLGADHAWANAESNPRVKFVYVDEQHGSAFADEADANRQVTITVTPVGDYRCMAGDLSAIVSLGSGMAQAPRRTAELEVGQPVAVTCTATNVFTLTLPEDESMNVTVYVSFRAKASLTVTANDHTINYGEEPANNGVTYSGFEGTDDASVLSGTLSFGYTYNQFAPVGTYSITPYGLTSDNYAITFVPGTLTVNPKSITINEASVNVVGKEYDGTTAATLSGTFSFNDGMIVGSDDVSISFNGASAVFDNKDAGNGKEVTVTGLVLTGADMNNYDLRNPYFTTTGSITKKDLTVTAKDHMIFYGNAAANDGVTYSSFVNGEDENDLGGTLTYTYSNGNGNYGEGNDAPGVYDITPDGLTSDNYEIKFVPGKLTVTPVEVRVCVVDETDGEEIEGATVQVLDGENVVKDLEGNNVEWTSGKETHTINVLKTGVTYTLHETVAPEGYTIPADITFTIDVEGNVTTTNGTMTQEGVLLVENAKTKVKVKVVDVADGEEIEGATIQVIDPDNKVVEEWTSTPDNHVIEGLKTGEEYTLRETVAPEGYTIPADFTFTIDETGKITSSGTITQDGVLLVENSKTKVKVSVVDVADGEEIEGATIQVIDPDNMVVEEWTSTKNNYVIEGLKTGVEYTLRETVAPNRYAAPDDYTFVIAPDGRITFSGNKTNDGVLLVENTKTGDLVVTNTLVSDLASDVEREFTFTVTATLGGQPISGNYGGMTFDENGVATFTLKGGQEKTAANLLYGTTYTVTQEDAEGFTLDKTGDEGTISTASTLAVFTNTRETGNLKVTNTVYPSGDNTAFTFMVKLSDTTISGEYGDMTFADGEATFALTGQTENNSKTATGLPTTVGYTVTQTANNDFSTTKTGDEGTISSTTQSEAAFKNIMLTDAHFDIAWRDGNNASSSRPTDGLTTALLSKIDGDDPQQVQTITLNAENSWHATITNLPMYNEDGLEIAYSWREIESVPSGYLQTGHSTGINASYTYTLTTSATVKVVWDDANDQDGKRPETLTATLKDDSEYSNTVTLNSTNSWTATVEDLPKYKVDNSEITYTWTQNGTLPEGYASTNPSIDGIVTTITNSHTPEETEVNVSMVWDDNNDNDRKRPSSVTVKLKKGDEVIDDVVLSADNEWTYTWPKLNKFDNGTAINYTVTENPVANYSTQITKADGTFTYTVTNSRTVEETEATVKVVWVDGNNELHNRPASVTATLWADGTATENTVTMNAENDWTATAEQLNKYKNGTEIVYTWSQDEDALPEGYIHTNSSVAGAVTTLTYVSSVDNAYTITQDQNGVTLTLVVPDENTAPQTVSIPTPVEVDHVVIDRLFEKGKAATVYLPFSIEVSKIDGGTFHTFESVDETTTPLWTVNYSTALAADAILQANTPYIFMPDDQNSGKITVNNGNEKVSVCTANTHTAQDTGGNWEFIGTYDAIVWISGHSDLGKVYGFAAEEVKDGDKTVFDVGQFVRVGAGANIAPMRAYLKRTSTNAPSMDGRAAEDLPATMRVVLINSNGATSIDGKVTGISEMRNDAWYTLDGRKVNGQSSMVNGQPLKKGMYIHNGRKEVIR